MAWELLLAAGHMQLLSTSVGVWAGQLLPGFAGRAAVRCLYSCIRYLEAEGSEESKAGREGEMQKKKVFEIPQDVSSRSKDLQMSEKGRGEQS